MNDLAPISLFVFNRPLHTQATLNALSKNTLARDSDLIVFSDGARNVEDQMKIDEVRKIVKDENRFKTVSLIESSNNKGLARSIIDGVGRVVFERKKTIVLEDDLVTSEYFLRFMDEALVRYAEHPRVISISGYMYPVKEALPETFFLNRTSSWGWATWDHGWSHFCGDSSVLIQQMVNEGRTHDFDGGALYFKMLQEQVAGKNDSWAIRFMAASYLKNLLTLYPRETLVRNIGFDGSGTHCSITTEYDAPLAQKCPTHFSDDFVVNREADRAVQEFFKFNRRIDQRAIRKLKKVFGLT